MTQRTAFTDLNRRNQVSSVKIGLAGRGVPGFASFLPLTNDDVPRVDAESETAQI